MRLKWLNFLLWVKLAHSRLIDNLSFHQSYQIMFVSGRIIFLLHPVWLCPFYEFYLHKKKISFTFLNWLKILSIVNRQTAISRRVVNQWLTFSLYGDFESKDACQCDVIQRCLHERKVTIMSFFQKVNTVSL